MATEFNFLVDLNTSRASAHANELAFTTQMAVARGFQSGGLQATGMTGAGDIVSGGMGGLGQMFSQMTRFPTMVPGYAPMFGGTFTNEQMAYTPHWGKQQAETSLVQEWMVDRYGMAAAGRMRPPGVGAGEYAMAVERNYIDRLAEARNQSYAAARTTVVGGALGIGVGGPIGQFGGAALGGLLGRAVGLGPVGALVGGFGGYMLGMDVAESATQQHYSEIELQRKTIRELGEIAGGGRNLSRVQRSDMGAAAMSAAKEIGMDVQQMGDILAGARQMKMLPSTTDPMKLKDELKNLASAIEEGAQALHTSAGKAMSMIRGMTSMGGGTADQAVGRLVGLGAAMGMSPEAAYGIGMQGAGIARQNLIPGGTGFDLFTSGVMQATGIHARRGEISMAGGRAAIGQQFAMHEIAANLGPQGDAQLMAGLTGRALPRNPMALVSQAVEGISAGGDILSNLVNFDVNKDRLLAVGGARAIDMRAREQVHGMVEWYKPLMPNVSDEGIASFYLRSQGVSDRNRARLLSSMYHHQGGGRGDAVEAAQLDQVQGEMMDAAGRGQLRMNLAAQIAPSLTATAGGIWDAMTGSQGGRAGTGAGIGSLAGLALGNPLIGAAIGAGIGYFGFGSDADAGKSPFPKLGSAATEERENAARMDAKEKEFLSTVQGAVRPRTGDVARARRGDFSQSSYDLDEANPLFSARVRAMNDMSGIAGSDTPILGGYKAGGKWFGFNALDASTALSRPAHATESTRAWVDKKFAAITPEMGEAEVASMNKFAAASKTPWASAESTKRFREQLTEFKLPDNVEPLSPEGRAMIEGYVGQVTNNPRFRLPIMGDKFTHGIEQFIKIQGIQEREEKYGKVPGQLLAQRIMESTPGLGKEMAERAAAQLVHSGGFKDALLRQSDIVHNGGNPDTEQVKKAIQTAHLVGVNPEMLANKLIGEISADTKGKTMTPMLQALDVLIEDKQTKKDIKGDRGGRSKPGPSQSTDGDGITENAIGFGQLESALTTINRSLRETYTMLSSLSKGRGGRGRGAAVTGTPAQKSPLVRPGRT